MRAVGVCLAIILILGCISSVESAASGSTRLWRAVIAAVLPVAILQSQCHDGSRAYFCISLFRFACEGGGNESTRHRIRPKSTSAAHSFHHDTEWSPLHCWGYVAVVQGQMDDSIRLFKEAIKYVTVCFSPHFFLHARMDCIDCVNVVWIQPMLNLLTILVRSSTAR